MLSTKPDERVVILRREGVELVIVAAGTGQREAEERFRQHVDLVVDAVGFVLANVDRRVDLFAEKPEAGPQDRFVRAGRRVHVAASAVRSPAMCSTTNRSYGTSAFSARIT